MNRSRPHDIVTGGSGFIGGHLVAELLRRGRRVTIVDRQSPGYHGELPGCTWIARDIRDGEALRDDLRDDLRGGAFDVLYHLAASTGVRSAPESERELTDINVAGTLRIAALAEELGVRQVVFAGSSSVYGNADIYPTPESAPYRPISPYGESKMLGEEIVLNRATSGGETSFSVARLFTVFGPGGRPAMAVPSFVAHGLEGRPLPVFGSVDSFRDFTHVRDVVSGLTLLADVGTNGCVVNIASGRAVRLRDLVVTLGGVIGQQLEIELHPGDARDVFGTHADLSVARALGYRPRVRLFEGLEEVVAEASQRGLHGEAVRQPAPDMAAETGEEERV